MPHPANPQSAPELTGWRKSSYSGDQGACVEMATGDDIVAVRDSKDPGGPVLSFGAAAWTAFAAAPPRP